MAHKQIQSINDSSVTLKHSTAVLFCFFSRPRSDGWPQHGHTFSIYLCPLLFWLTIQ